MFEDLFSTKLNSRILQGNQNIHENENDVIEKPHRTRIQNKRFSYM